MDKSIASPEQITPEWLNTTLSKNGVLTEGKVLKVSYDYIGTGKMGDNVRLYVEYDSIASALSLPSSYVAKLPAQDVIAKEMSASSNAYGREVLFYQNEAQHTAIRLPTIYYSEVNSSSDEFIILMEDLSPAEPGNQIIGETEHRALAALNEVAKLHAAFWGPKNISGDHISRPYESDSAEFGGALLKDAWPKFLSRFETGLTKECVEFGSHFADQYSHWIQRFEGPRTLIHSDFRSENILFVDHQNHSEAITVDWQSIAVGCGLTDVAYFLGGSLERTLRQQCEQAMVEHYRQQLTKLGINITGEDCWAQYREFAMGAFMTVVLGAVYTGAEERSDQMFLIMAQRHLQQCVDLDSAEFLSN